LLADQLGEAPGAPFDGQHLVAHANEPPKTRSASARPRHPIPPLPLLPSGPDGVCGRFVAGEPTRTPATLPAPAARRTNHAEQEVPQGRRFEKPPHCELPCPPGARRALPGEAAAGV